VTVAVRTAGEADEEALFAAFASGRIDELAALPWTSEQKRAFLRQQFALQTAHYGTHYPSAESMVIELDGTPIGRLYVDRGPLELRLMDIALLPEHRGRGIGGGVVRDLIDEAVAAGVPVTLHVEAHNPARRLYERLGFVLVEAGEVYDRMERPVEAGSACER
jgi:ribosomal protein S18 acetylase RimI-like enzyme